YLGRKDARQRALFDECLRGFCDDRIASLTLQGRDHHGHGATDAVTEQSEPVYAERGADGREVDTGLLGDEIIRRAPRTRRGIAKAEPVVRNDFSAGGRRERAGEVAPQLDTAQRIMQQDV